MKMLQKSYVFLPICLALLLLACSTKRNALSEGNLADKQLLIIGLIEYDFSQLENKTIGGIRVFFESKEKFSDFKLPGKYLPMGTYKKYRFIDIQGRQGIYDLCQIQNKKSSADSDNLLSLLDAEKAAPSLEKKILQQYQLNDGKIINIGKITVQYLGGEIINGNINYTYKFKFISSDTTAINALKKEFPQLYKNYQNDIYVFKSDFEECLDYILNNISPGKALLLTNFIEEHPDELENIFTDLSPETQKKYAEQIEKYTFEELKNFLYIEE